MARINGHGPKREQPISIKDEDCIPRHLPYVLLCRSSAARCGWTRTVNRGNEWKDGIRARDAHETLCPTLPDTYDAYFDASRIMTR